MVHRLARLLVAPGLVAAAFALQPSAEAGLITSFTAQGGGSAQANAASYTNFDAFTLGSGAQTSSSGLRVVFATDGASVVNGSVTNQYSAPIFSGGNNSFFYASNPPAPGTDTTNYLSTGTGTITFSNATTGGTLGTYFGLLIGSLDSFNTLTFNFADNTSQQLTGATIATQPGVVANGTTTYFVNVFANTAITSVVASSGTNSLEIENVAFGGNAVPEPASLALVGLGLAGVAFAARKRQA